MKEEASFSILFAVVFIKFGTLLFLLCILDIGGWDVYESILSLSLVSSFLVNFCFFLPFWAFTLFGKRSICVSSTNFGQKTAKINVWDLHTSIFFQ